MVGIAVIPIAVQNLLGTGTGDTVTEEALSIDARYRGRSLDLEPGRPDDCDLFADGDGLARLPALLIRQYADGVRTDRRDGECRVRLHFEH